MGEQKEGSQPSPLCYHHLLAFEGLLVHPWDPVILEGRVPG